MSHCVLEVFIKNAGGLLRSKSDALALEVRGLGNQTSRHRESAELRDAFPGLDTMQHHDLRESERPTKGQVSLPDDGRLFVSYSPPVCTFNPVLKWLLWNTLPLHRDAGPSQDWWTPLRQWGLIRRCEGLAIPIDFCLSSLTYFIFVTAFSGSATKEATQSRGAAGRRPLGTRPQHCLRRGRAHRCYCVRTAAWETQGAWQAGAGLLWSPYVDEWRQRAGWGSQFRSLVAWPFERKVACVQQTCLHQWSM